MILISNYFIGPTQHIEDTKQELPLVNNRMTYVKDLEGFEYDAQYTYTVENEVNGNQKLTATIEYTETNSLFIDDLDRFWNVTDHQGVEYKVVHIDRQGKGNKMFVQVIAEPLFFYYMERDYLKKPNGSHERFDGHLTAKNAADKLFDDTPFDYVLVDSADSQEWENFGGVDNTKLEMFNRFLNRYQYEFEIHGSTIYFKNRAGRDTSILYAHKFNASDIQQSIDATEQFTAIHGYGDYGDGEGSEDWQDANLSPDYPKTSSKYVAPYISPLASILGVTWGKPIINGNMKRAALEKAMKEAVDTSLKVSVNANIHNLSSQDYPIDQSRAGDRVYLVDERIGLNEEVRIVSQSITRNWKNKVIDANVTFGNEGLGKRHQANINSTIKDMSDIFSGKKKLEVTWLPDAVKHASDIINNNIDSFFEYQAGSITGYNRSNPNEFMRFNTDGLGFSRDGGNTYQSAITYEGIVADAITTGTLRSIIIEGVEIYGSYFESFVSDKKYTKIENAHIESRGVFDRTFRGVTATHEVSIRHERGYIRLRNEEGNEQGRSLYLSDFGLSTYIDGIGEEGGGSSGSLIWWDTRYSPTSRRGITLNSWGGTVSMVSDRHHALVQSYFSTDINSTNSYININPFSDESSSGWRFSKSEDRGEGYFTYGYTDKSGFRMLRGGNGQIEIVDKNYNTGGDTYIEAGVGRFNRVTYRTGNLYIDLINKNHFRVGRDNGGVKRVASDSINSRTYGSSANVHITDSGTLGRSTSAEKYKISIENQYKTTAQQLEHSRNILDLDIVSWFDKTESETLALEIVENERLSPDNFILKRIVGTTAERVERLGFTEHVVYNKEGDLEEVAYDRLWLHLIPVARNHETRLEKLERENKEMRQELNKIKGVA